MQCPLGIAYYDLFVKTQVLGEYLPSEHYFFMGGWGGYKICLLNFRWRRSLPEVYGGIIGIFKIYIYISCVNLAIPRYRNAWQKSGAGGGEGVRGTFGGGPDSAIQCHSDRPPGRCKPPLHQVFNAENLLSGLRRVC